MIVFGKRVVIHLLQRHKDKIKELLLSKEIQKSLFDEMLKSGIKISKLDPKKAQALAKGKNHQGFFAKIEGFGYDELKSIKKKGFLVVLCGLTDVGNIGAIIRSAYCLGVDGVVISGVKSIPFRELVRSSSGAVFEMPIVLFENTLDLINELKMEGFVLYGAEANKKDIRDIKIAKKRALFLGAEDKGLPKKVEQKMDFLVSIKMQNSFDSLNVNAAAAILIDRMRDGED